MKVLIINGSPHSHGCVGRALVELENTLTGEGIEVERSAFTSFMSTK